MFIPEEDAPHAKAWLMKKLPDVSDTETDILADYVIALLTTQDGSVAEIRTNLEQELQDFLNADVPQFVDEVLRTVEYKSYLPGARPPPPKIASSSQRQQATGQTGQAFKQESPNLESSGSKDNKKRSFEETGYDAGHDGRALKQRRQSGGLLPKEGSADAPFGHPAMGSGTNNAFAPNSWATAVTFEPMSFNPFVGMPGQPGAVPGQYPEPGHDRPYGSAPQHGNRRRKPCFDFQTKGFCARGHACKFDHGTAPISMPHDGPMGGQPGMHESQVQEMVRLMFTQNAQQMQELMEAVNSQVGRRGGRGGRGSSQGSRRRGGKAAISADGPVHDHTKSTIVVENIPQDNFSEEEVRKFFAQFGNIVDLSLQPYKRLAIVKYESWAAANAAYRSPKVVFDNRFVRVFWYKGDDKNIPPSHTIHGPNDIDVDSAEQKPEEPEIDMEEFMRKQEEAQKRHEENMRKISDIEQQRLELEQQQKDLQDRQREVREKLWAKLGSPAGGEGGSSSDALRAQLAALEEEAKFLGIDPDADDGASVMSGGYFRGYGRGRGRGRGRGSFTRGRGSYRGGRGDIHAAYASYSLDNRPKVVAVSGLDMTDPSRDEALRQHLLGVGEFSDISSTPESTQITFNDRKTAEKFFYGVSDNSIPGVDGKVELSWVSKPLPPVTARGAGTGGGTTDKPDRDRKGPNDDGDDAMTDDDNERSKPAAARSTNRAGDQDMDYEQAEEGEWGIE